LAHAELGIEGSGRAYVGTSGTAPNDKNGNGGTCRSGGEAVFLCRRREWLGPHNKHGAMMAHAMFGGVDGNFQKDLLAWRRRISIFTTTRLRRQRLSRKYRPEPVGTLGLPHQS